MSRYADTSFLLSLAIQDTHYAAALTELAGIGGPPDFPFSAFSEFEARNALRGLVWRGAITPTDEVAAARVLRWMLVRGQMVRRRLPFSPWFAEANRLSGRLTVTVGTRSLDVLHAASACFLGAAEFFSFDHNQRRFAQAAGFALRPDTI